MGSGKWLMVVTLCSAACDVGSAGAPTGGVDLGDAAVEGVSIADGGGDAGEALSIVRGFAVFNSDYESTSISLLGLDGTVLSESFLSSSSTTTGLSEPLSGDVVPPTQAATGKELVLIDRYPASVITWVDLTTATVRTQLSVGTGFVANPHDYVAVSPTKAYVTRYQPNLDSGKEPFDGGADVLVVDPSRPAVLGRVELQNALTGVDAGIYARGERAILAGGRVRVAVVATDLSFDRNAESRIATIDPETDAISDVLVVDAKTGCSSLAPSPDGTRIAVACSGSFAQDPASGFPESGVVVVAVGDALTEVARIDATDVGGQISWVEWESNGTLLVTTYGRWNADRTVAVADDTLRRIDLGRGTVSEPLLTSLAQPFSIGEVRCAPRAAVCFVTDAEREGGVVHRLTAGAMRMDAIKVDRLTGLPPRSLGVY